MLKSLPQNAERQAGSRLAIGAAALIDFSMGPFALRLHFARDRSASGMGLQDLPEETSEGAHPGEDSLAAARSALGLGQQGAGQEPGELRFDFSGAPISLGPPSESRQF
jgi:hypothetical protein